jgi:hypothetical protein
MSNVEPLRTSGPANVPAFGSANVLPFVTIVGPVNVFAPDITSAPGPALIMPNPLPTIGPSVNEFAPTFIVRVPFVSVTVAGPKSMLLLPGKFTSPPSMYPPKPTLRTIGDPLVLSIVPPLIMKLLPVVKPLKAFAEPAEAKFRVPAIKT